MEGLHRQVSNSRFILVLRYIRQNTWEPEDGLKETASDKIDQWQVDKVKKAQKKAERAKVRDEKKAEKKVNLLSLEQKQNNTTNMTKSGPA